MLLGFKQGCNKAYREIISPASPVSPAFPASPVPYVAVLQQQTEHPPVRPKDDRRHGLLFERSYNDRLLLQGGQLDRWYNYLRDNPRRLLMKREHHDLFHVQRGLKVGNLSFSAIGNHFLLQRPFLMQVQCSRSLTQTEILAKVNDCLKAAEQGAVLVSPSISPGEKAVMRAAFEKGFPLILLQENGMTDMSKPSGKLMEACAEGRLLLLAPWEHHNERMMIRRDQCISLNDMARIICSTL